MEDEELIRQVGARIRALRRDSGLSLEELSDRCDLHATHLSAIERGRRNPSLVSLAKVARGLAVDLSSLLAPASRAAADARSELRTRLKDANPEEVERFLRVWDALRG